MPVRVLALIMPGHIKTNHGDSTNAEIPTYPEAAPIDMNPALEAKLKNIPSGPGVYIYKDSAGTAIYVGKAKSLRNRVRSYFQDSRNPGVRLDAMMEAISDADFIVTDTEGEA